MDIEELRAAVDAAGPSAPGRRFSPELRQQLVVATHRLWESGEALADIAEALGVHVATATRYLDEAVEVEADNAEVELDHGGLVPVSVPITSLGAPALRLTTPEGFVVEGLDVVTLAELIRALR